MNIMSVGTVPELPRLDGKSIYLTDEGEFLQFKPTKTRLIDTIFQTNIDGNPIIYLAETNRGFYGYSYIILCARGTEILTTNKTFYKLAGN